MEEYLKREVVKGDAGAWEFFTGDVRLDNERPGILTRANARSSTANYEGCEDSVLPNIIESRPMGFKRCYLARQLEVQLEATLSRETRSRT